MSLKDTDDFLEEVTVGYMYFDCFQIILEKNRTFLT